MRQKSWIISCLRSLVLALMVTAIIIGAGIMNAGAASADQEIAIVIHGGAGTILREDMTPEKEVAYREALLEALQTGYRVLADGGTSLDAVVATLRLMEDSPLFNAGKGAVFTHEGKNELDASIMDGATLNAGAVAGVTRIRNPISLARLVMDKSDHVMLAGQGAEVFAQSQGVEFVDPEYFYTDRRWQDLQQKIAETKHGTVGAVALDRRGDLAAGTSTGGMTDKKFGRVGDSPIIGAGTYANNRSCAVSGTGHGEYFIRANIAHDICALVEYAGLSVIEAADRVIHGKLTDMGGTGGVIVLDTRGNIATPFNTPGMYRGYLKEGGQPVVRFYQD